jgi:hypothetical protein
MAFLTRLSETGVNGANGLRVVSGVLDFSRLQSDLLPRIAARDNNVAWFAGTSLDATRLPSHYRIRVRVTVGICLSTRYVATSGTQSGIVHPPGCDAPPLSAEGAGVHFV